MKSVGKPDALIGHVRFDERGRETGRRRKAQATAPFLNSTLRCAGRIVADADGQSGLVSEFLQLDFP